MRVGDTLYFDYQAATPVDPRVQTAMTASHAELFANPHTADHTLGWKAAAAIEKAAAAIGNLALCSADEVIFTSGASESNALALNSVLKIATETGRSKVIISAGDHSSILNECAALDLEILYCPLKLSGEPELGWLNDTIDNEIALVSLIGVNNENGAITDLREVGDLCDKFDVPFHADLSQSPLATDIDFFGSSLSFATLSSHKIYGPKGIGALLISPQARKWITPSLRGGGQQGGVRGGTIPTELCIGFAEACLILASEGAAERERVRSLRNRLIDRLSSGTGAKLIGALEQRHPGNALMHFPGHDAADLLGRLQPHIAASSQSACSSGSLEPSRIVQAMGKTRSEAAECIRFSLGRFSDEDQVDECVGRIVETLNV